MESIVIRKGTAADIPAVLENYNHIFDYEESGKGTSGWPRGIYPTESTVRDAVNADELYVAEIDGKVCGSARINHEQSPEYKRANWAHKGAPTEQITVLHTLAVDPRFGGKGVGSALIRRFEQYALEHNSPYLRMDTGGGNSRARRLYAHLGFSEADILECRWGENTPPLYMVCLEKTLS